jgi:hypothetical protein
MQLDDVDEINNASLVEYYPFCGSINFNKIFFSIRYYSLLEEFIEDNHIQAKIHTSDRYNIVLPEYADQDYVSVNTLNMLCDIHSCADKIFIRENITVADLYDALCGAYNAHEWYNSIKNHTFNSVLIDLSAAEMKSLAKIQFDDSLISKIDKAIVELLSINGDKCFVKLYSVSPKDEHSTPEDLTAKTGKEVLELLTSRSRTYTTICEYAKLNQSHGIMLREFAAINPNMEFRLFVYGNCLRAISQYKCYTVLFTDNVERKRIYNAICKWFPTVERDIIYSDYIVDIVLDNSIKIIEINSYGPGLRAGSCLYNWKIDYDIMHYSSVPDIRFLDF